MVERIFNYYLPRFFTLAKYSFLHCIWKFIVKSGKQTVVLQTRQGVFRVFTRDTVIAYMLFVKKGFEFESSVNVIDFLVNKKFVSPGKMTFVDVGANIGVIGIGLCRANKVERVISIEPAPLNFKLLQENIRLNNFGKRIREYNCALGNKSGTLTMELAPDNFGDHRIKGGTRLTQRSLMNEETRETVEVPSYCFDDLVLDKALFADKGDENCVFWIDVQGYEGYVFDGARKFLSRTKTPVVSEVWPYGILRAGMTIERYIEIVTSLFSDYWVLRGERFIRYPLSMFDRYLDELGVEGSGDSIVFTTSNFVHEK